MHESLIRVCCVALMLGCASPVLGQRVRSLNDAAIQTWAQVLRTHDLRTADTTAIDRALRSPVAPLRAAAARVIGLNRISVRYATLRGMLRTESDSAVASDAAFALGLAVDSASCTALHDALGRRGVAPAAAWALGDLNTRCGGFGQTLSAALTSDARAAVLRTSVKWSPFPDSIVIATYAHATSSAERWAALWALARARSSAGAMVALTASHDGDAQIRDVATRLLAAALQPTGDTARNVARLDSLLRDVTPHVRIAAVRAIAGYRVLAYAPLRAAWRAERDANVRVVMAQAIGSVAIASDSLWSEWWTSDTAHMVRRSLISSAWQADAIATLNAAAHDSLVNTPDFRIRIAMIEGAASKSGEQHLRSIADRVTDSDARVRAAAVSALRRLGAELRTAVDFETIRAAALQDVDAGVREAAVDRASPPAQSRDTSVVALQYERIVRDVVMPSLTGHAPTFVILTARGPVRIVLDGVRAPMTIDHLSRLARAGYFRNLRFHRVVPAFVAQTGDPQGDGSGGPGFAIRDELNRTPYLRGSVGMALSGPDTGGSQFFLTLSPQPHLVGHYTVFGTVVSGFSAMDALMQGDPLLDISTTVPR